jgi:hypothetical protein
MASFYKDWLRRNAEEDDKILSQLQPVVQPQQSVVEPKQSTSRENEQSVNISPQPSTSSAHTQDLSVLTPVLSPSDVVYEQNGLQLLVERGIFQRQNRFNLQASKLNDMKKI